MNFLIINGPNLNLLGQREPGIYGDQSYEALCTLCRTYAKERGAQADCFQSNHEGAIIDAIHAAQGVYDAIIINPGAYTHYSYAIYDALKAVAVPAYEVHISHIDQREPFRAVSVTAPACVGQIYGQGFPGYLRAMDHFLQGVPAETGPSERGKLCVIGDPVGHSKSPRLQTALLTALGEPIPYEAVRVAPEGLNDFLARVRAGEYRGFNATMPHKEALLTAVDRLDESARQCGAVNTVAVEGGRLVGYNTDGDGFVAALENLGIDAAEGEVLLLGAGGAAKSVALALARAGAERITVCNRGTGRAAALCARMPGKLVPAELEIETLRRTAARSRLLVNCTSLGMTGEFPDLSFLEALPRGAAVCDVVYEPAQTALLARAAALGHLTMNGLPMLIWQGVLALEKFLGRPLERERLVQAAERALAASEQRGT